MKITNEYYTTDMEKFMITRKDLIWVLDYVEFSGIFICKATHWRVVNRESYQSITINGTTFYASLQARLRISGKKITGNENTHCYCYWDKADAKWLIGIRDNGRIKKLGRFFDDDDVAAVIREAAEKNPSYRPNHGTETRPL